MPEKPVQDDQQLQVVASVRFRPVSRVRDIQLPVEVEFWSCNQGIMIHIKGSSIIDVKQFWIISDPPPPLTCLLVKRFLYYSLKIFHPLRPWRHKWMNPRENIFELYSDAQLSNLMLLDNLRKWHDSSDDARRRLVHAVVGSIQLRGWSWFKLLGNRKQLK